VRQLAKNGFQANVKGVIYRVMYLGPVKSDNRYPVVNSHGQMVMFSILRIVHGITPLKI
jgi:hypothetical protein